MSNDLELTDKYGDNLDFNFAESDGKKILWVSAYGDNDDDPFMEILLDVEMVRKLKAYLDGLDL